jgi:hypothetical protein
MRLRQVALVSIIVSAVACGDKGGGAAPMDAGGSDVPQDSGTDTPVVIHVPDSWSRPADCHGVGQTCDLGCGDGAICQLDGYVCIPKPPDLNHPAGNTADTPYCLAYSCMTYDQASCFCTGPAGAQYPSCKYGPPAVAGLCAGEASSCDNGPCCAGLDCVSISPTHKVCYDRCSGNADCDTNCCTDRRDTGDLVCAPLTSCQTLCTKRGQACTGDSQCCNGVCVMDSNPDWKGCRPACSTNADCDTGCCQLFANSTTGFCTSPGYCGCGAGCPAGSSCVTFDGTTLSCKKDCTVDTDCPSVCCSGKVGGTNHGVCVTSECPCVGGCKTGETCLVVNGSNSCEQNCMQPSDCSTDCCSADIPGKNYGSCMPAAACGLTAP